MFRRADEEGASAEDVAETIENELPDLAGLAAWLRRAGPILAKALWPLLIGLLLLFIQQRIANPTGRRSRSNRLSSE
jgi:hypothetical protein